MRALSFRFRDYCVRGNRLVRINVLVFLTSISGFRLIRIGSGFTSLIFLAMLYVIDATASMIVQLQVLLYPSVGP